MKKNNLLVAGKDCEGCEYYIYGNDKKVYCKMKNKDKGFMYGQYITCEKISESNNKRKKKK